MAYTVTFRQSITGYGAFALSTYQGIQLSVHTAPPTMGWAGAATYYRRLWGVGFVAFCDDNVSIDEWREVDADVMQLRVPPTGHWTYLAYVLRSGAQLYLSSINY